MDGSKNADDGPSRRADYEIVYEMPVPQLLSTVSVEPYNQVMAISIDAKNCNPLAVDISVNLVNRPNIDQTDASMVVSKWKVIAGVMTHQWRIYFPALNSLLGKVISLLHDIPGSSYFGGLKTTDLVSLDFYWPVMDSPVHMYVTGSKEYHRIKTPRPAKPGETAVCDPGPGNGHSI